MKDEYQGFFRRGTLVLMPFWAKAAKSFISYRISNPHPSFAFDTHQHEATLQVLLPSRKGSRKMAGLGLEELSRSEPAKDRKKGFSVGPDNLPDGVHRRKGDGSRLKHTF